MNLYRLSLKPTDVFSRFYSKKIPPIYLVAETKDAAFRVAEKHLKDGLSVKSISVLGVALGDRIFSGSKP